MCRADLIEVLANVSWLMWLRDAGLALSTVQEQNCVFRGKPNSIPGQVEQDSGLKPNSIPG
jgi:hypothetical protein